MSTNDNDDLEIIHRQLLKCRKTIRVLEDRKLYLSRLPASQWDRILSMQRQSAAVTIQRMVRGWLVRKSLLLQPSTGKGETNTTLTKPEPDKTNSEQHSVDVRESGALDVDNSATTHTDKLIDQALVHWRLIKRRSLASPDSFIIIESAERALADYQSSQSRLKGMLAGNYDFTQLQVPSVSDKCRKTAAERDRRYTKLAQTPWYRWRIARLIAADQALPELSGLND